MASDLQQCHGQEELTRLTARSGFSFDVRPVRSGDEAALGQFFTHVAHEDLRFRFLTALNKVGPEFLEMMVEVDHDRTENFLALDPASGTIIATAMVAADEKRECAEVALSIRADYKKKGISWTLLEHAARWAKARGFKCLKSIESRENHQAIELEREMGFCAEEYPGDSTLILLRAELNP
ncbi:GNAT family N-acetyltransferase [Allosphingosinicella flava]|uniref:GNAT family N-acetyltransferase n=1 Tax=Allosphingosinicella flava TaxID=2771430 RepID=A0A7T2GJL5_9SPHN|nr:GNAT family N-acetyltransferase [Sphingosinicella flava]QPQ54962.1 GNAT family N-acetyltransferase [Sphingosinicella flava]